MQLCFPQINVLLPASSVIDHTNSMKSVYREVGDPPAPGHEADIVLRFPRLAGDKADSTSSFGHSLGEVEIDAMLN